MTFIPPVEPGERLVIEAGLPFCGLSFRLMHNPFRGQFTERVVLPAELERDGIPLIVARMREALAPVDRPGKERAALIALRDAVMDLVTVTQLEGNGDTFWAPVRLLDNLRKPLNDAAGALRG